MSWIGSKSVCSFDTVLFVLKLSPVSNWFSISVFVFLASEAKGLSSSVLAVDAVSGLVSGLLDALSRDI